ncbi:hypothetical protein [Actinoplanes palleronii]|uniref:DUF3592 domain-containing protein n=1 Tax=Actinoplanes palleronii TaxID=113570 RepID=A0ABQ4BBP8_9ACTN|nr:hypothetical protein [Actinoplanes palleronii]GIE68122.1 hypothetical protein Apa02nite_042300 [Actinoplanes palleronii]
MGRKTRAGKVAGARQGRINRWTLGLALVFAFLVAVPAAGVVWAALQRFGTIDGPGVIASGTATISGCDEHVLGTPYTCAASVAWRPDPAGGEPAARVTVNAVRSLTGEVEVQERNCGRPNRVSDHTCAVYAADYPRLPGVLFVPPIVTFFGLIFASRLVAGRIARRITGEVPPG